jgi:hypothetical protein
MFFDKKKQKEEINYREIDLTKIDDPVKKAETVIDAIIEDLGEHIDKPPLAIALGLVLNRLCNEIVAIGIEPDFKEELLKQMKEH